MMVRNSASYILFREGVFDTTTTEVALEMNRTMCPECGSTLCETNRSVKRLFVRGFVKANEKAALLGDIAEQNYAGNTDEPRLLAIKESRSFFQLRIPDEESFLALIWQDIPQSKILTPRGGRTLQDVAQRMHNRGLSFRSLVDGQAQGDRYNPSWFKSCVELESHFDYEQFRCLILVHPTDREREQNPGGSMYIYEGVHRSLVLAHLLLMQRIIYRPVEAIFLLPRPRC